MKEKKESEITDYYEALRKSLISRMKSEDEEKINLKIKIATYVIYELSHSTPSWFRSYFLSDISKNIGNVEIAKNKKIIKAENEFYNKIGDYLINLESEVEYVKKILAPLTEEWDKKDFWRPIVADAFYMADIYFTSLLDSGKNDCKQLETETSINPRYLFQTLIESPATL
ncbi:MAG: hypothetical protein ABFD50_02535 [Smithella sp.]